jgi:predicted ATPase
LHLSPQRQKQKTQEALLAWLVAETGRQPVLAVWEDLHWADPSTLEWLNFFLDQVPTARLLTMLTCRPEFRPPWASRSYLTQLTVSRFTRSQAEEMVKRVAGGKPLPPAVVEQIVTKTDGVPLFVEELTKMLLESGLVREEEDRYGLTSPLPPLAIPATLQDSLMARLDRLLTAKGMAQLGAVLGRQFSFELLQAVSDLDDATLQRELGRLVEAEFIYQRGLPPQATYTFKHALIQEAAYQSLLKRTRQQYHQRIAQVLEARFPETVEAQPELLAHHYTEAGLGEQAIGYWQRAGERAVQRSANVEAIAHLTKGLEVLRALPDTSEHARQELDLQTALGPALRATKGWTSPEAAQAYTRARELCHQVGDTSQLFPVLFGLWASSVVRPELQTARELGELLLRLGQNAPDPSLLLQAHWVLGSTLFFMGAFASARAHLEHVIALYEPQQHRSHTLLYGQDTGVTSLYYAALALWYLGYPDQALQRGQQAVTLAQELSHPISLAFALEGMAELSQFRREAQRTQERAEALLTLSTEQRFAFWVVSATVLRGWALAEQGQGVEGIAQIRQGLAAWQAMGEALYQPHCHTLLANAYGNVGQTEAGLTVLAEVLADVHNTGLCYCEAELYRLKGELLLQAAERGGEAEACLRQALDVARRQQAKSLELRAAMSLSRLWQHQGKRAAARELLAEIYGWFTEGFDTADLQEAKALLEEPL